MAVVDLRDQDGHSRIHTQGAGIGKDVDAAIGQGRLDGAGDICRQP